MQLTTLRFAKWQHLHRQLLFPNKHGIPFLPWQCFNLIVYLRYSVNHCLFSIYLQIFIDSTPSTSLSTPTYTNQPNNTSLSTATTLIPLITIPSTSPYILFNINSAFSPRAIYTTQALSHLSPNDPRHQCLSVVEITVPNSNTSPTPLVLQLATAPNFPNRSQTPPHPQPTAMPLPSTPTPPPATRSTPTATRPREATGVQHTQMSRYKTAWPEDSPCHSQPSMRISRNPQVMWASSGGHGTAVPPRGSPECAGWADAALVLHGPRFHACFPNCVVTNPHRRRGDCPSAPKQR